jgi:hypothetical protein
MGPLAFSQVNLAYRATSAASVLALHRDLGGAAGGGGRGRPELLPQLRLDELLAELPGRLQAVLSARDRMPGLLEAVVALSSRLDLESTLRRIVETAVRLVDATYSALGVIGDGDEGGARPKREARGPVGRAGVRPAPTGARPG